MEFRVVQVLCVFVYKRNVHSVIKVGQQEEEMTD